MQHHDIIVLGGGMAGISAAARLSDSARVVVLEAEDAAGRHSTGRSAAIFIPNYGGGPVMRRMNALSLAFFRDPAEIGETGLLTPRGELLIAAEDELGAFAAYLDGATGMEEITPEEAVSRVPILRRDRIAAAAWEPEAEDIDVDRMLQGFIRLLKRSGGQVVTSVPARAIARKDGVWQVETPQGSFAAPVLVNATGGWADIIADMAGVPQKGLVPHRRSAALLPMPEGHDMTHWPMFGSAAETWYAKPDAGRLMVSPADQDPVTAHDVFPDDMVLAEGLARYEAAVTVPVTRVLHRWAGMRTFAPDRVPMVGFDPAAEGFFWLAGQGGSGIQTAPAMSRFAADLILGRSPELSDDAVAALSPGRILTAK